MNSRRCTSVIVAMGFAVSGLVAGAPAAMAAPASTTAGHTYRVYNYSNSAGTIGVTLANGYETSVMPGRSISGSGGDEPAFVHLSKEWCVREIADFGGGDRKTTYHDGKRTTRSELAGHEFDGLSSNIGLYKRSSWSGCLSR